MVNKTAKAVEMFKSGDFKGAFAAVKNFRRWPSLDDRKAITRASEMMTNSRFYTQMGYNVETEIENAKKVFVKVFIENKES